MVDIHILKATLIFLTANLVVVGCLVNCFEKYLPAYILRTFRFGKHAYVGKKPLIPPIEVPKRWFRHFYIFSSLFSLMTLILAVLVYVFGCPVPQSILNMLDVLGSKQRVSTVFSSSVLLALTLVTAQCWRRFYETQCVSIFSDSSINLAHYIIGYLHYFLTVCCVLVEAPKFANSGQDEALYPLKWYQILATGCFTVGFFIQYQTTVNFANLRKSKSGSITTTKHLIPKGGLFEWVSSPHYLGEVIIYFSLAVILWGNISFVYVAIWVFCNQVESALLTHWWYKSKFKEYPSSRAAIFPFIL